LGDGNRGNATGAAAVECGDESEVRIPATADGGDWWAVGSVMTDPCGDNGDGDDNGDSADDDGDDENVEDDDDDEDEDGDESLCRRSRAPPMADAARGRAGDSNELGGGRGTRRVEVHIIRPPLI
jgi:hypothetical protein